MKTPLLFVPDPTMPIWSVSSQSIYVHKKDHAVILSANTSYKIVYVDYDIFKGDDDAKKQFNDNMSRCDTFEKWYAKKHDQETKGAMEAWKSTHPDPKFVATDWK